MTAAAHDSSARHYTLGLEGALTWNNFVILLLILLFVTPFVELAVAVAVRRRARGRCERERGTRVLPLVLGMDLIATYGLPVARFETLPLPGELAAAIEKTSPETPIELLIDLPAGLVFEAQAVAEALRRHPAPTTAYVPRRALTAGAELARAVDRVVLGAGAVVGDEEERPLSATDLGAQGIAVEAGVPGCIEAYLGSFARPHRPRFVLPFYVAVPRRLPG